MENQDFILQANPKAGYLTHQTEIDAAIRRVLESGWYILGEEVEAFEQEFAAYVGVSHALGVANGTDALEIALRACGVKAGDTVITVSHTAVATVAAIELVGATPVLVDIDPVTFTLNINGLEDTILRVREDRNMGALKAIIPVHLYGHPANLPEILELADRYDLYVIEDCAQAHGAAIASRQVGAWGHLAAFSFYPTKNLGALGDGGAVVTDDPELAEKVSILRQYGWRERFISDIPGMNTRLDPLQASILREKLRFLDRDNLRRREIAQQYNALLEKTPLKLPQTSGTVNHVYHQYVVRELERDRFRDYLKDNGIGTAIHYPVPVHLQPAYRGRIPLSGDALLTTERIAQEIVSLPMYPELSDKQVQRIGEAILRWYK